MTDHTEMQIPDDVMEAAKQCTRDMFIDPLAPMWPHIARAILAERQRCQEKHDAQRNMGIWKF